MTSDPPQPNPQTPWTIARASLAWLAAPGLYGAALLAAARLDGTTPGEVLCYDPWRADHAAALRLIVAVLMAVGGLVTVFVAPWLVGRVALLRLERTRATAGAWSAALNTAGLIAVCLLLRETVGIGRWGFLAAWLVWTAVLLGLAGGPRAALAETRRLLARWRWPIAVGLAAVAMSITLFGPEQFGQCFEGDGTETYELSRSLRGHFLPYWEIEAAGGFGNTVAHPAVIEGYWTLAAQLVFGQNEFGTRIVFWVGWLGVFAAALAMASAGDGGHFRSQEVEPASGPARKCAPSPCGAAEPPPLDSRPAALLGLSLFLIGLWYTFYMGYDPSMADLASPGIPDAVLTVLFFLALHCLRQGDLAGWAVMLALCSLTSYAGPVLLGLSAAAAVVWRPVPVRRMVRAVLGGGLLLAAVLAAYAAWGWWNGWLDGWRQTFSEEVLEGYYLREAHPSASVPAFVAFFLLGTGGLTALGVLAPLIARRSSTSRVPSGTSQVPPGRRDLLIDDLAWQRAVATIALAYLLIIFGSRSKSLHYLGPLMLLPPMLWLRSIRLTRVTWLAAALSLSVCIGLSWPAGRAPFTLNHELGRLTTFQTDSYEEAVDMAGVVHGLRQEGLLSWEIGPHTLVLYSALAACPGDRRPFVVTRGAAPSPEYRLLYENAEHSRLYCGSPDWARWLREQRPSPRAERTPWALGSASPPR